MNLLPGRPKAASAEPNDDAIRRTHEYLRCGTWHECDTGWVFCRQSDRQHECNPRLSPICACV